MKMTPKINQLKNTLFKRKTMIFLGLSFLSILFLSTQVKASVGTVNIWADCSGTQAYYHYTYSRPSDGATWQYNVSNTSGMNLTFSASTAGSGNGGSSAGITWTVKLLRNGGVDSQKSATAPNCSTPQPGAVCGNHVCEAGESYSSCPGDCPDTSPPSVSVTSPSDGAIISGTVTLSANAADPQSGISQVRFLVQSIATGSSTTICTDTSYPYSCPWNTTSFADGGYRVYAEATNRVGLTWNRYISVSVANVGPTCTCTVWVGQGCKGAGCASTELGYIRSCTPAGCLKETNCVADVTCGVAVCGNGKCETEETHSSCPSDCPSVCTNQCSSSGTKQCVNNNTGYQTCGDYNSDGCLEWSITTNCPSGQTCSGTGNCSGTAFGAPTLVSPINGTEVSSSPTFKWSKVSGATHYGVWVSENSNMSNSWFWARTVPSTDCTLSPCSLNWAPNSSWQAKDMNTGDGITPPAPPFSLVEGKNYYWSVWACKSTMDCPLTGISLTGNFITTPTAPAPTISLIYPFCSVNISKTNIYWKGGDGSQGFWIDIDNDGNWGNGFWNKNTTSRSILAPDGFAPVFGATGSLILNGGSTYYVRVYDPKIDKHSLVSSFTAKPCGSSKSTKKLDVPFYSQRDYPDEFFTQDPDTKTRALAFKMSCEINPHTIYKYGCAPTSVAMILDYYKKNMGVVNAANLLTDHGCVQIFNKCENSARPYAVYGSAIPEPYNPEPAFKDAPCFGIFDNPAHPTGIHLEGLSKRETLFNDIARYIDSDDPVFLGIQSGGSGHALVAKGYRKDASGNADIIYTNDPAGGGERLLTKTDLPYILAAYAYVAD